MQIAVLQADNVEIASVKTAEWWQIVIPVVDGLLRREV